MQRRLMALIGVIIGTFFGDCTGFVTSSVVYVSITPQRYGFLAQRVSLPHHVPQFRGGVSLRLAMVQDVLHERFPKHGSIWYETRNRETGKLLSLNLNGHSNKDPQRNPVFFNEKSSRILEKKMRSLATRGLKGVRGLGVAELWIRSVG